MARDNADPSARIRQSILRHIRKFPQAADTADGILAYWLPDTGFEHAPDHIAAVLEDLVAERRLQAQTLPDGNILYARGDVRDP